MKTVMADEKKKSIELLRQCLNYHSQKAKEYQAVIDFLEKQL